MFRSQERTYFAARLVPRTPTPFCSGFLVQPPFLEVPVWSDLIGSGGEDNDLFSGTSELGAGEAFSV